MLSHEEMQFDIYKYINSEGNSADVVSLFTTSILCSDMSIFTSADKYSFACAVDIIHIRHSKATRGLFSTNSGN